MNSDTRHNAVLAATTTAAYYALPDITRSKALRTLGKTGLMVGSSLHVIAAEQPHYRENAKELGEFLRGADADTLRVTAAMITAVSIAATAATVACEKAIFRRGERRRAEGRRLPHTRQALVLGLLSGLLVVAAERIEIS